jgi:hypothetical protein
VIAGTAAQIAESLRAYAAAGASEAVLVLGGSPDRRLADLEQIARAVGA